MTRNTRDKPPNIINPIAMHLKRAKKYFMSRRPTYYTY